MPLTLTFSSVDNPEIPILLHVLNISGDKLEIKEVVGRAEIALDGELDTRVIFERLASMATGLAAPKTATETVLLDQWVSFALGRVRQEIKVSHDFDSAVLAPLHAGLERRVFLTGSFEPSIADWLLFSMLLSRIVHIYYAVNV